jgi:hypothetical protein
MSAELTAAAAAWLAHVLWYAAHPVRARCLELAGEPSPRLFAICRSAALALAFLGLLLWVRAYGPVLGGCFALAALTAAASINTILAPLRPRAVLAAGVIAAALFFLGFIEVWVGA